MADEAQYFNGYVLPGRSLADLSIARIIKRANEFDFRNESGDNTIEVSGALSAERMKELIGINELNVDKRTTHKIVYALVRDALRQVKAYIGSEGYQKQPSEVNGFWILGALLKEALRNSEGDELIDLCKVIVVTSALSRDIYDIRPEQWLERVCPLFFALLDTYTHPLSGRLAIPGVFNESDIVEPQDHKWLAILLMFYPRMDRRIFNRPIILNTVSANVPLPLLLKYANKLPDDWESLDKGAIITGIEERISNLSKGLSMFLDMKTSRKTIKKRYEIARRLGSLVPKDVYRRVEYDYYYRLSESERQ